jgi:hypothetical protein
MAAFAPTEWHDFFVGTIGASAALTGLLFVAISINLQQILKYPQLPGRAAGTLGILVCALVVSGFGLAPGQGNRALGLEIAAAGAALVVQAAWVTHRRRSKEAEGSWEVEHLVSLLLPSLAFLAGGCRSSQAAEAVSTGSLQPFSSPLSWPPSMPGCCLWR